MSREKAGWLLCTCVVLSLCVGGLDPIAAQAQQPAQVGDHIHVVVNLVQLNVAVTDGHGKYVTGLQPGDFNVLEDGISEDIATFGEGNGPARQLRDAPLPKDNAGDPAASGGKTAPEGPGGDPEARLSAAGMSSMASGANVFVLFDTSNYMYRGFVFAQDAISDFIRSLEGADRIAFYSYSRDLSRAARLTAERSAVLQGVRTTVAGDDAALYNCLLLTVKDAAQFTGRKIIVVFSNGPDNASVVPPEDVAELAESTGIVIYMVSTQQAELEPISTTVFERMTAATGGKAYFSKSWKDEQQAFASIRDDLAHLYFLTYYPKPNPNIGWRTITVRLTSSGAKKYQLRTRKGYRLLPTRTSGVEAASANSPSPQSPRSSN
jgi:Ca-activated chloride channel homolog